MANEGEIAIHKKWEPELPISTRLMAAFVRQGVKKG